MKKVLFIALLFLQNADLFGQCNVSGALSFNGTFKFVSPNILPSVNNNFTIEMWVMPMATHQIDAASTVSVGGVSGQRYTLWPTHGLNWGTQDAGAGISVGTNGVSVYEHGPNYMPPLLVYNSAITGWTHIAVVYINKQPHLYVNGNLVAAGLTSPKTFVHPSAGMYDGNFGGGIGAGNYGYFNGKIDEVRIWNFSRTQSQIQSDYQSNLTGQESGLFLYYDFNDGSPNTTANDGSPYNHDGTLYYMDPGVDWVQPGAIAGTVSLISVSTGVDENTYFGYAPDECVTKTATVTYGTSPFTYNWTLDRALLPGETMTGTNTAAVTVCLMDTAELCVTITDANNCTATDCANIFAEDVRCGTGNNQKVMICHNDNTICVDESAVAGHLAHGDYVGPCGATFTDNADIKIMKNATAGFSIYPNPSVGDFIISVNLPNGNSGERRINIINSSGQLVKQLNMNGQNRISLNLKEAGTYSVQLITNRQVITKKLVVIH